VNSKYLKRSISRKKERQNRPTVTVRLSKIDA
jgi:hypothetical protein